MEHPHADNPRIGLLRERAWRRVAIAILAAVCCVQVVRMLIEPRGDFHLHWQFGGRLAAGQFPYDENGLDLPYLPFWAVAHVPLSWLPMHAAQICLLPLFFIAAYGLFRCLSELTEDSHPVSKRLLFWITVATLVLASRFLIRDVMECGVNLALVTLAWAAVWCWRKHRDVLGGGFLGLAIALKLTPALFLAWFAWKRQWKIAFTTTVTTVVLLSTPLVFLGPSEFYRAHYVWWHHASRGLMGKNPVHGVLGEESIQNVSLRPAIARFLVHLPEGHNARFDHPWSVQFLDLSSRTASWIVKALTLLLVGGIAWRFRRVVTDRDDETVLWEAAVVSVLILLLSPLTWGQHCVGVIPAFYLVLRSAANRGKMAVSTKIVIAIYAVLILGLNRGLIGKEGTYLLDSYYTTTWCLLAVLGLVMMKHRSVQDPPERISLSFPTQSENSVSKRAA